MFVDMVRTHVKISTKELKSRLYDDQSELKKLISQARFREAKAKASTLVKLACRYSVYDVACTCYDVLMKFYSLYEPSGYWYNHYKVQRGKYRQLLNEEEQVREFYHSLNRSFDRNRTVPKEILDMSESFIKKIKEYESRKDHGPYFYFKFYLFLTFDKDIRGDQLSRLKISDEAISYFRGIDDQVDYSGAEYIFLNVIVDTMISMNKWEEASDYMLRKSEIATNQSVITKASHANQKIRLGLYFGNYEIDNIPDTGQDEGYKDQVLMHKLLAIYSRVLQGFLVDEEMFKELSSYKYDPAGLGLSLNIARLINAYNSENSEDYKDSMRIYKKQRLQDDARGRL